ncbi:hypothetical protein [Aliivibrio finisterrensis]|uniref:DUF4281 domain-containing protein n=2 Tax=Aliivibrio finisterrensis TaxID=511998 RepID=A0ABY0IAR6_9GAMM|nr:hypothetical protein [Aliivibrio finisterrensis]RYU64341.1 hypothetical protein ERW53_10410 [Aliivibrio finisterrensis]RYU83953.1 hypothetical protein ERW52_12250 [Aliivibrio finisterrensis]
MFKYKTEKPLDQIKEFGSWLWVQANWLPILLLSIAYVSIGLSLSLLTQIETLGYFFIGWGLLPMLSFLSVFWNPLTKLTFGIVALPELFVRFYHARNENI